MKQGQVCVEDAGLLGTDVSKREGAHLLDLATGRRDRLDDALPLGSRISDGELVQVDRDRGQLASRSDGDPG